MNHICFHYPESLTNKVRLVKDCLSFFHLTGEDQRMTSLSSLKGFAGIDGIWNNYYMPNIKKTGRREAFNQYCELVRHSGITQEPISVVIFATGHNMHTHGVYFMNKIYDGILILSLCSGIPIVPVYNAYFIATDKTEHFRQMIGNPIWVKRLESQLPFDIDVFRNKYSSAISNLRIKVEAAYDDLTSALKNAHLRMDSHISTEWPLGITTKQA